MLSTIADIAGILSFCMSIILFVLSHSLFKNAPSLLDIDQFVEDFINDK